MMQNDDMETCTNAEGELDRVVTKLNDIRDNIVAEFADLVTAIQKSVNIINEVQQELAAISISRAHLYSTDLDNLMTQISDVGTLSEKSINIIEVFQKEIAGIISNADPVNPSAYEVEMQAEMNATIPHSTDSQIEHILDNLEEANEKLSIEHRGLHGAIPKVRKVINGNFGPNFIDATKAILFQEDENLMLLNRFIGKHYCRQASDNVARFLIKEPNDRSFAEIFRISKEIQRQELGAALEWAERYSTELAAKSSRLESKLYRLKFYQNMTCGADGQGNAPLYYRNFITFVDTFRYNCLASPEVWMETSYEFLMVACGTLGISKESTLFSALKGSFTSLPTILKVIYSREVANIWKTHTESPIFIDLEANLRERPPLELICGHIISQDALEKFRKGHKFKCPYCAVKQRADKAVRIQIK